MYRDRMSDAIFQLSQMEITDENRLAIADEVQNFAVRTLQEHNEDLDKKRYLYSPNNGAFNTPVYIQTRLEISGELWVVVSFSRVHENMPVRSPILVLREEVYEEPYDARVPRKIKVA